MATSDIVLTIIAGVPTRTSIEDSRLGFTNDAGTIALGDVVYVSATEKVSKALAGDVSKTPIVGVVGEVLSATTCQVVCSGGTVHGLAGLTPGTTYWLSTTVAGTMTPTRPASGAYLVGVAVGPTDLLISTAPVDIGASAGVVLVTASPHNVTVSDRVLLVDLPTATNPVLNLPAGATHVYGRVEIKDKKGTAYANPITVNAFAGETIDGDPSLTMPLSSGSFELQFAGTEWSVF